MRLVCWVTRLTWCKSCIGRGRVNLWVPGWRRLVLVGIDLRRLWVVLWLLVKLHSRLRVQSAQEVNSAWKASTHQVGMELVRMLIVQAEGLVTWNL